MTIVKQFQAPAATNTPEKVFYSSEFKKAAFSLVSQLKTRVLKDFLIEKLALEFELDSRYNFDLLTEFEKSRPSRFGAFYTSESSVERIISRIELKPGYQYLDPGVGTGNFILALSDRLLANFSSLSLDELLNSIYGFELEPESLEICKIRFLLKLENFFSLDISTYEKLNLYLTDFTVKAPTGLDFMKEFNPVYRDSDRLIEIKRHLKFDYVFGNPPFVTFYGRRSKKLPEVQRIYYLNNYEFIPCHVKNGKLNLYMFFIEHGLNLLKEEGNLIYLLDNSIYETSAYHLRKWVLEHFQITSIDMGLADFESVASGQTIWHLTKRTPLTPVFFRDISQNKFQKINQSQWLEGRECQIKFNCKTTVLDKFKNYPKLSDYFPKKSLRTCCMLLDLTDKFLADREEYERDKTGLIMPYLEGSKSLSSADEPFRFTRYIKYDRELQLCLSEEIRIKLEKEGIKNKKRLGLGVLEIYQSPKIFIRQSSHRLVAKFTAEKFMANNSLYVLTPIYSNFKKENWQRVLIYTERLLNSKLYLYLAYQMKVIRRNVKQQPQIKVSDLKRLPFLLEESSSFFEKIINFSDKNKIDLIVYDMFELTSEEVNQIEYFLRSL